MGWLKPVLCTVVIVFLIGIVATGGVLIWLSTIRHTCSDWEAKSPYFPLYDCGYTNLNLIASTQCNTKCYCVNPAFDYKCIDKLPGGVSVSFLCGGIAMIIGGLFLIAYTIIRFVF